jgi:hypothetical protein
MLSGFAYQLIIRYLLAAAFRAGVEEVSLTSRCPRQEILHQPRVEPLGGTNAVQTRPLPQSSLRPLGKDERSSADGPAAAWRAISAEKHAPFAQIASLTGGCWPFANCGSGPNKRRRRKTKTSESASTPPHRLFWAHDSANANGRTRPSWRGTHPAFERAEPLD